jgi:hypothetical protein
MRVALTDARGLASTVCQWHVPRGEANSKNRASVLKCKVAIVAVIQC